MKIRGIGAGRLDDLPTLAATSLIARGSGEPDGSPLVVARHRPGRRQARRAGHRQRRAPQGGRIRRQGVREGGLKPAGTDGLHPAGEVQAPSKSTSPTPASPSSARDGEEPLDPRPRRDHLAPGRPRPDMSRPTSSSSATAWPTRGRITTISRASTSEGKVVVYPLGAPSTIAGPLAAHMQSAGERGALLAEAGRGRGGHDPESQEHGHPLGTVQPRPVHAGR